jgi:cell division protein FtsQ
MLGLATAGLAAFALFVQSARPLNSPTPALAEIEQVLDLAGFGLTQVSLAGHRYTPDSDILDAVGLGSARTMLTFDSRAAKARVEALPWVERASIERILPDRLEVRVTERAPFAVWSHDGRHSLIDRSGRELAVVPVGAMPTLPRISGEGAAMAAAALFSIVGQRPDLAARISVAERISGRRWTLRLAGGGSVQLPAQDEAAALDRALQIAAVQGLEASEIDVRVPGRALVRASQQRKGQIETAVSPATGGT